MSMRDYFRPVRTTTPQQVRELMDKRGPEDYNLVDVRQPGEYRQGHLPGARLIPLAELPDRMGELDASKPTVTY